MEDVATEFDIQGLELDWVGVCWDADLRHRSGDWHFHAFRGSRWNDVRAEARRVYLLNAYRVLLTRARRVIARAVAAGEATDHTRPPAFYDGTYQFLLGCGLPTTAPTLLGSNVRRDLDWHARDE